MEIVVPTNDGRVKQCLVFFGESEAVEKEDPADRRERLRQLLSDRKTRGLSIELPNDPLVAHESDESDHEFYTEGSAALLEARQSIYQSSMARAKRRLELEKKAFEAYTQDERAFVQAEMALQAQIKGSAEAKTLYGSQSGFSRPVSAVNFSPLKNAIVAADWSGTLTLVDGESMELGSSKQIHAGKVSGLAWNKDDVLASGGVEGDVVLSSGTDLETLGTLKGHTERVTRLDYDPSGKYLASASFDTTWRLWDVESSNCLLTQPGHSKAVFTVKFHPDGSLLASAGLDALGRVWDLRTGQTIMILDGHIRDIYGLAWSPSGYELLSGGADNAIMVWDLRKVAKVYEIPAHLNVVSDLCFDNNTLVSASYDHTVRIWGKDSWKLLNTVSLADRVLAVDAAGGRICAGRWDRVVDLIN